MRSTSYLINEPNSDITQMNSKLPYFTYITKNYTNMYQEYHIEVGVINKNHAKRKIRKIIESKKDFMCWV